MKVLVIGAGVVGVSTAFLLERDGHEVSLVDCNPSIAEGASRANGGQLSYSYVAPLAHPSVFSDLPGWLFKSNSPIRFNPRFDIDQCGNG